MKLCANKKKSTVAGKQSSWRPPWFETHTASAPCCNASSASSPVTGTAGLSDFDEILILFPKDNPIVYQHCKTTL